jgi:hypothetical protein
VTYRAIDQQPVGRTNRDAVYWYGDMEFIAHFWKLFGLRSVEVMVVIQPKVECFRYPNNSAGRRRLAEDCYERVLGRFNDQVFGSEEEDNAGERRRSLSG